MTDQTVTPAEPTDQPIKSVGELEPGDWTAEGALADGRSAVAEILSVHPYTPPSIGALVVFAEVGGAFPTAEHLRTGARVLLATDGEVAEAKDAERRQRIAGQLRQLAALVVDKKLPLPGPYQTLGVTFNFGSDAGPVDEVAAALGIEARESYGTTAVEWPAAADQERGLLTASWTAYARKKPKLESTVVAPVPAEPNGGE